MDLEGTLSRTVIALGYGANIVGKTVSSTEKQLAEVPVVTQNGHTLNVEAILALQPTVILVDRSIGPPEAIEQLRAAGIPIVLVDPARGIEKIRTLSSPYRAHLAAKTLEKHSQNAPKNKPAKPSNKSKNGSPPTQSKRPSSTFAAPAEYSSSSEKKKAQQHSSVRLEPKTLQQNTASKASRQQTRKHSSNSTLKSSSL